MAKVQAIIVGISAVSLSAIGFYVFYKKKFSRKDNLYRLEIKIPDAYVGYIIGRCGGTLKNIEKKCSTKIEFIPGGFFDNYTKCIIKGDREKVKLTEDIIRNIIKNYDDEEPDPEELSYQEKIKFLTDYKREPNPNATLILSELMEQILLYETIDSESELPNEDGDTISISELPIISIVANISNFKEHKQKLYSVGGDGYIPVCVSAVASPQQFWVQVMQTKEQAELDRLTEDIFDYYLANAKANVPPDYNSIQKGNIYATFFEEDNRWYRSEVSEIYELNKDNPLNTIIDMYFLDYGESSYQKLKNIRVLPVQFLDLSFQAVECGLSNIMPIKETWSEQTISYFEDLTHSAQWYTLKARIDYYLETNSELHSVPFLKLIDANAEEVIDINEKMVESGFAVYASS